MSLTTDRTGAGDPGRPDDTFGSLMGRASTHGDTAAYRLCLEQVAAIARCRLAAEFATPEALESAVQRCLVRAHAKRATFTVGTSFDAWVRAIVNRELTTADRRPTPDTEQPGPARDGRAPDGLGPRWARNRWARNGRGHGWA